MYCYDYYSNFSRINKHYHIINRQMLNATQSKGLLESMLNADNKYLIILDVISRKVKIKIKNSCRTIKKYFSSFKVVGKTPKCNTARAKRTEDDSGGTDSDPDPDRSLTDSTLLRNSKGGVRG